MAKKKKAVRPAAKKSVARPAKKAASRKKTSAKPAGKPSRTAAAAKSAVRSAPSAPAGEARRAIELLDWSHQMTRKLCGGFPDDKLTFQPSPTDNHLLWQIGHLATAYAWFASMLDGGAVSLGESFDKSFGYASKPVPDASAYPALPEVQRIHDEQYTRLFTAVSKVKDADVTRATVTDSGGFIKNRVDLIGKAIWHEGWHQGQISSLRRALALPSAM